MADVHVLDSSTINKIAAGEVVERPASVVKELVENSIDAGAAHIEIEVASGGTSLIRVTDDGCGMSMKDAKLAIERHATSKISEASDLERIDTLGFRGEALPTIAAVSRFMLFTREKNHETGTRICIEGGRNTSVEEAGGNIGTTVRAEDLFFNVPARKKFLKTNHTEGNHCSDVVTKLALSHPEISFRFINNGKQAMKTPGTGSLFDTIQSIYGGMVADSLLGLELEFPDEEIHINGYITKPSMLKSSRAWQTLIVNGRAIGNRAVMKAIDNAYRAMIPKSGFPLAVLCIDIPQRSIDVNIHPRKSEVKFQDESTVFKAVYKSIVDAIRPEKNSLDSVAGYAENAERHVEHMEFHPGTTDVQQHYVVEPGQGKSSAHMNENSLFDHIRSSVSYDNRTNSGMIADKPAMDFEEAQRLLHRQMIAESPENNSRNEKTEADNDLVGSVVAIGQVDKTYIIAKDDKGLYIVDQHAAHERILFDKYSGYAEAIPSQQLLVHQILEFDQRESEIVGSNLQLFRKMGFAMEQAGDHDFRLMEIPMDIPEKDAEETVREILSDIFERKISSPQEIRQSVIATASCRAAIKAGDELNQHQMQIILDELSRTEHPYTCPHGRPTILKFTSGELAKMFKRTGF